MFCSDDNLFVAISNPTAYCEIHGESHILCCSIYVPLFNVTKFYQLYLFHYTLKYQDLSHLLISLPLEQALPSVQSFGPYPISVIIIRLFAGFTYQAGTLIFSGFWLLFVAHLFLKLVFPLQFRKFDSSKYRTKVHILEIVIVLLLGILIPAIVVGTVEYNIVNFPPTQCSANVEVTFYTLILPTIFIQGTGMMLILFSFVSIHRVS